MSQKIILKASTLRFEQKKFAVAADKQMEALYHGAANAFLVATVRKIPVRTGFLRGAFTTLEDAVGAFEYKKRGKDATGRVPRPRKSRAKLAKLPSKKSIAKDKKRSAKLLARLTALSHRRNEPAVDRAYQKVLDQLSHLDKMRGNVPLRVARTNTGRIRGRNILGRGFRLEAGERITSVFRLVEYYQAYKKSRKILKTPRSGRQFATPSKDIITKTPSKTGVKYGTSRWVFKYSVNIRYWKTNDDLYGWGSLSAGQNAFASYMQKNFKKMFPDVKKFFVRQRLKGGALDYPVVGK